MMSKRDSELNSEEEGYHRIADSRDKKPAGGHDGRELQCDEERLQQYENNEDEDEEEITFQTGDGTEENILDRVYDARSRVENALRKTIHIVCYPSPDAAKKISSRCEQSGYGEYSAKLNSQSNRNIYAPFYQKPIGK
jgi:hypothetical protein